MSGAGSRLQEAALAALRQLAGLSGAYDGPPLQAAFPHAVAEAGPESDWSHKSGAGREVRLAVVVRDRGERPARLRRLMDEVETATQGVERDLPGWRIVSLHFLRSRVVSEGAGKWAGLSEYRARMEAV